MADANTLACAQCAAPFPQPATRRGARPQTYCSRPCQIKAANARRATTRTGRKVTNPQGAAPSGLPSSPALLNMSPSVDRSVTDARNARISALMTLAHSRGGIDPWQIAELAKLRNISPWAPLRVILGHQDGMK
jgi:hypothetical protein